MSISNLHLYGPIAETFGAKHTFEAESVTDCIALLTTSFDKAKIKEEFSKYDFEIIRGNKETGKSLDKETVLFNYAGENDFHLVPVVAGSGKGTLNIIAGVFLLAAAFIMPAAGILGGILTPSTVGMMGVGLILSGVGLLMSPTPTVNDYSSRNDNRIQSYLFNGPVNVTEEGATIPLVFGEFMCGSITIASEINNEDIL